MTTSYSDEDVVATLKKLSDGCSRLYGAVTKARKVIRKQWNLRPGQEGIKDVLAASHLGSYSVFAPPWYRGREDILLGHRHAAPHDEMKLSILHDYAKDLQAVREREERIRRIEQQRRAAEVRMKEEENRKAAPVVLKAERPPVGADVEATRIAEARSVEETAETKEQEVAEHDNDWMFGDEIEEVEELSSEAESSEDASEEDDEDEDDDDED